MASTRTWETREFPILEAIRRAEEEGREPYLSSGIGESLGLSEHETMIAFRALEENGYITAARPRLNGGVLVNPRLLEPGRQAVGQWPGDDPIAELVAVIERLIAQTAEPEERGRLERIRAELVALGRGVATALGAAWAQAILGPGKLG